MTQAFDDQYNGLPPITGTVTIEGNGATISGMMMAPSDRLSFRVLNVTASGDLTLRDTTIADGFLYYYVGEKNSDGAGIFSAGRLTLEGSTVADNYSSEGTCGIFSTGDLIIRDSTISGNRQSYWGDGPGGIANKGDAIILDSSIVGNYSYIGVGGILNTGTMTIANSELSNAAGYQVGGILNDGVMDISDSSMVGDGACYVHSIDNRGEMTISNSTISGSWQNFECVGSLRSQSTYGFQSLGAYGTVANSGRLTLNNTTVSGNTPYYDAAIWNDGRLTLNSTIVSGNIYYCYDEDYYTYLCEKNIAGPGPVIANNFNVFGSGGDAGVRGFRPGARDIVPDQPIDDVIRPLDYNGGRLLTHALPPGSPAIDLAPSDECAVEPISNLDERGLPRNVNGDRVTSSNECDAGAFEAQSVELENAVLMTTMARGITADGLSFRKTDILKWNGTAWSIFFDGRANGLPASADITAISVPRAVEPTVYLSFLANVRVPGVGLVTPHDVVRWDGTGFSLHFDGSDVGLTTRGERIDALEVSPSPDGSTAYLWLSTTGAGEVQTPWDETIPFRGEDVLDIDVTQTGQATIGEWGSVDWCNPQCHRGPLIDGSEVGMPANATISLAQSSEWPSETNRYTQPLYLTTKRPFTVDDAFGTHSMVFKVVGFNNWLPDLWFSGPYFSAADHGLLQKVDGLEVLGDLP